MNSKEKVIYVIRKMLELKGYDKDALEHYG